MHLDSTILVSLRNKYMYLYNTDINQIVKMKMKSRKNNYRRKFTGQKYTQQLSDFS